MIAVAAVLEDASSLAAEQRFGGPEVGAGHGEEDFHAGSARRDLGVGRKAVDDFLRPRLNSAGALVPAGVQSIPARESSASIRVSTMPTLRLVLSSAQSSASLRGAHVVELSHFACVPVLGS